LGPKKPAWLKGLLAVVNPSSICDIHIMNSAPENKSILNSAQSAAKTLGAFSPHVSMVLGSGWSCVIEHLNIQKSIPYSDIDGLGNTGVKGHKGAIHQAVHRGMKILIFEGRRHYYEGQGWAPVIFPAILSSHLKVDTILLTNAAGGISRDFPSGSIMLITDHINLMGANPLIGPHDPLLGERFPDMTNVYSKKLTKIIVSSATKAKVRLRHGIYAAMSGPSYETPAEIGFLAKAGADAVGMSTVPEAIVAKACGIQVCALSFIANRAAGLSGAELKHDDVLRAVASSKDSMTGIITGFLDELSKRHEDSR
jgi:purine-nucleoside phosphorylase